jgi:hypothetical protein
MKKEKITKQKFEEAKRSRGRYGISNMVCNSYSCQRWPYCTKQYKGKYDYCAEKNVIPQEGGA